MASWTPEHSRILSQMLDEVIGTPEVIDIRQDYCRLWDCLRSTNEQRNVYFTGRKAEGLYLPGSDVDYMFDINDECHLKVIQSLDENPDISPYSVFLMCTEHVHPGFTLLQHVNQNTRMSPFLYSASQSMNGLRYLSSELFMQNKLREKENEARQGPSVESLAPFELSGIGTDNVSSIHCPFWPYEAEEWIHRLRNFDWPTSFDISSITEFGCHLVPVGFPLSPKKMMEWRISFSIAERALVWSFNHIQMQCYAIMKIILKEIIKVRCSPQNQVLCSYFIKTFLFWKYEKTESSFWRADNFRECIKVLLSEFSKCIQEGELKHYFIPRFNLLSIKLTRSAQIELLQLFDIIVESDINILKECKTFQSIWSSFLQFQENQNNVIFNLKRRYMFMKDKCVIGIIKFCLQYTMVFSLKMDLESESIIKFSNVFCKTHLKTIVIVLRNSFFHRNIMSILINSCGSGNKGLFQLLQTAKNDTFAFDISTCKLWCAIFLYMKCNYFSTLNIINQVLSNIPPYVMYIPNVKIGDIEMQIVSNEAEQLYVDMFMDSDTTVVQRARKAWMSSLHFPKDMINTELMPLGIKIELYFTDAILILSPFTCIYYLQFMCYHEMGQYDRRDRTLQQLTEVATDFERCGNPKTTYNITGHCLLLAGKRDLARHMFNMSNFMSKLVPQYDKYNSAVWYLRSFCAE